MSLLELQQKYTSDSNEDDLIKAIGLGANQGLNPNENSVFIDYINSLIYIKQQQNLLSEQSKFNKKILKTNKDIVLATWVLVATNILLTVANIILMFKEKFNN